MNFVPVSAAAPPPDPLRRVRVCFTPPGGEPVSLWVTLGEGEGVTTLTLDHDYPDFAPEPGWEVTGRGLSLEVVAADGRTITAN